MLAKEGFACTTAFLVFAAIAAILRKRGAYVIAISCFFVICLVTTQLLMSLLSAHYKHPGFVTMLHFGCVWLVSCFYWLPHGTQKWWSIQVSSQHSADWFLRSIIPLALSNPLTVVFNNTALTYVGAGMCAIVGTLSPVSVAILSWLCGCRLSFTSWSGIFIAFGGALIIATGEASVKVSDHTGSIIGLTFALAAVGARSMKIVIMDVLLAPKDYEEPSPTNSTSNRIPLSPMELYSMQAPWCFITAMVFALSTESFKEALTNLTSEAASLLGMTCVSATALNFAGIFALKELGASSQQIIGKLNTICVAAISMGFLNEQLSGTIIMGSGVVLCGAALVEMGKMDKMKDFKDQKRLEECNLEESHEDAIEKSA